MFSALGRWRNRRKFAETEFAPLFAKPHPTEKVSLDCEFTSLDCNLAEIVSIGTVKIRDNQILRSGALDIKIKAPASLPAQSIKIHGLRPVDLAQGISLEKALKELLDFIGNRPIIGYCIPLDLKILNRHIFRLFGFRLHHPHIDVGIMYHRAFGHKHYGAGDLSFEKILSDLNIPTHERHSALGDALMTAVAYLALKNHR